MSSLRPVEQNVISEIYVRTFEAKRLLKEDIVSQQRSLFSDAVHFDHFPGLKSIVVDVYIPLPSSIETVKPVVRYPHVLRFELTDYSSDT